MAIAVNKATLYPSQKLGGGYYMVLVVDGLKMISSDRLIFSVSKGDDNFNKNNQIALINTTLKANKIKNPSMVYLSIPRPIKTCFHNCLHLFSFQQWLH